MVTGATAHKDLGLLSLVVGDRPGLEVLDRHVPCWFPIEQSYKYPAATVLVGRQLERLSNGRYTAGGHLVRTTMNGDLQAIDHAYRHSIVFILRAHSSVPVDSERLTSTITGPFLEPLRDIIAGDLFRNIRQSHYNVNATTQTRAEQKKRLERGGQDTRADSND